MATVYWHDAAKTVLDGDLRLNIATYEKWQRQHPLSPLPVILKATNMLNLAAGPMRLALAQPDQNTEGFAADQAKLEDLRQYLLANKPLGSKDPYWYQLMVEIGIFQNRSEDEIKRLVAEGLEAFPENIQLPILASNRFTTSWGASANAFFLYADWAQHLPAMKKRPDFYPRLYAHAMHMYHRLMLFRLVLADWDQML